MMMIMMMMIRVAYVAKGMWNMQICCRIKP